MCLDESSREIQKFVNKSLLLCLTNKACLTILLKRSRREFNIVYIFYCYKAYFCKLPRSGQICLCPPALGVSTILLPTLHFKLSLLQQQIIWHLLLCLIYHLGLYQEPKSKIRCCPLWSCRPLASSATRHPHPILGRN